MTQLGLFGISLVEYLAFLIYRYWKRLYHREYLRLNRRRLNAKRMASKYKCLDQWRSFLHGDV